MTRDAVVGVWQDLRHSHGGEKGLRHFAGVIVLKDERVNNAGFMAGSSYGGREGKQRGEAEDEERGRALIVTTMQRPGICGWIVDKDGIG